MIPAPEAGASLSAQVIETGICTCKTIPAVSKERLARPHRRSDMGEHVVSCPSTLVVTRDA
jgi:hypothetical protein